MRAVCTGNGWSPNPADLNCFSSILDNNIQYMRSYLQFVYNYNGMLYEINPLVLM